MMFVTFLLFQRNFTQFQQVHRDLFNTKNLNIIRELYPLTPTMVLPCTLWWAHSNPPPSLQTPNCVLRVLWRVDRSSAQQIFPNASKMSSSQNFQLIPWSKKIGTLIYSMKFLSPKLVFISINLPYGHAQNTAVMSGLTLLVASWNCTISYKDGYEGLWSFTCYFS